MAFIRVQHVFNPKSGQAVDSIVNTWHFRSLSGDFVNQAMVDTLAPIIEDFYTTAATGTMLAMNVFAGGMFATPRSTMKFYDLSTAAPRVPVASVSLQAGGPNNSLAPLPAEVALCLSFRGSLASGTNAARRRGRVFLGPLNTASGNIATETATGHSRPHMDLQYMFTQNANRLKDDALASGYEWSIYSPKADEIGTLGGAFTPVAHVWVDNAWDTQRRRGVKPTSRIAMDV